MSLLLVDDDLDIRSLLSDLLSLEGFEVDEAENGQLALEKMEQKNYRLVLLDVMMPVMDGVETLQHIRQRYQTPVLMLTARGDEQDRINGLELGADDYLAKPFNDRELVARIKAILRRSEQTLKQEVQDIPQHLLEFEGLALNRLRKQLFYKGKLLDLTSTELGCLEILLSNINEVVSRDLLSIEVLGKKLSPFDRSVDMHMSNLRKKLPEREDGKYWFKTLRGRGYIMISEEYTGEFDSKDVRGGVELVDFKGKNDI